MKTSLRKSDNRKKPFFLVLDVGTTAIKACVFDECLTLLQKETVPTVTMQPKKNWVELDPEDLLKKSIFVLQTVLKKSERMAKDCLGLGITNQRETTILWNKKTGKPVYPAIVWKDERTNDFCQTFSKTQQQFVKERTGLCIDSYFSASKIWWIFQNIPIAEKLFRQNCLRFGTVDSWILWHLCPGHPHLTDETNASRTLLFDIQKKQWSDTLCQLFSVPKNILPSTQFSKSFFGKTKKELLGYSVPILSVCGDQQASLYAAGTKKGTTKVTFGTGTFLGQNIGTKFMLVEDSFTTLVVGDKKSLYGLERKIPRYGKELEPFLNNPQKLHSVLKKFFLDTEIVLKNLPLIPKELVLDGGGTRDGILKSLFEKHMEIPVKTHDVFDGTALGVAKMIKDSYR